MQRVDLRCRGRRLERRVQGLRHHHAAEGPIARPPGRALRREGRPLPLCRTRLGRGDRVEQVGDGGRDDLRLFCRVKLQRPPPDPPARSRQLDLDRQTLRCQVHAAVVLGVAKTLHVEEPNLRRLDGERTPVPRAPVQDERLEGFEAEDPDRFDLVRRELDVGRRHRDHRRHVERHQGLGVGVVAEQHLAAEAVLQLGHLAAGVADEVHVGVVPLERHALIAVPRIGVGHGEPAERRPGGLAERFGVHGFGVA